MNSEKEAARKKSLGEIGELKYLVKQNSEKIN